MPGDDVRHLFQAKSGCLTWRVVETEAGGEHHRTQETLFTISVEWSPPSIRK